MGGGKVPAEARAINNVDVFEEEQRAAFPTLLHAFLHSLAPQKIVSGSSPVYRTDWIAEFNLPH